jgi:hypothetical protein
MSFLESGNTLWILLDSYNPGTTQRILHGFSTSLFLYYCEIIPKNQECQHSYFKHYIFVFVCGRFKTRISNCSKLKSSFKPERKIFLS